MATSLTSSGIIYSSGLTQLKVKPIIKHRLTSGTTVDQAMSVVSPVFINGCEISMGVPTNALNWYRVEYYSAMDDIATNQNAGIGFSVWRYTPSSGWNRAQDQGQHAMYDNNAGDFYTCGTGLWYIPVHPTYPTEAHSFRIYGYSHNSSGYYRVNCNVGNDNRNGNWQNNLMEVMEIDGTVATSGSLTRY